MSKVDEEEWEERISNNNKDTNKGKSRSGNIREISFQKANTFLSKASEQKKPRNGYQRLD